MNHGILVGSKTLECYDTTPTTSCLQPRLPSSSDLCWATPLGLAPCGDAFAVVCRDSSERSKNQMHPNIIDILWHSLAIFGIDGLLFDAAATLGCHVEPKSGKHRFPLTHSISFYVILNPNRSNRCKRLQAGVLHSLGWFWCFPWSSAGEMMDDLPENCHSLNLSDLSVWVWGLAVAFTLVGEFAHGVTMSYPALCLFRSRQTFRQLQSDQIILSIFAQDATSAHSTGRLQSFEVLPQDVLRLPEQKYLGATSLANLLAPKRLEGEPSTVYGDVSDPSYSLKSLQRTGRTVVFSQGKGSAVWSVCQIWLQNWQMHVILFDSSSGYVYGRPKLLVFDLHHKQDASALERSWHYAHKVNWRVALSLQVTQSCCFSCRFWTRQLLLWLSFFIHIAFSWSFLRYWYL